MLIGPISKRRLKKIEKRKDPLAQAVLALDCAQWLDRIAAPINPKPIIPIIPNAETMDATCKRGIGQLASQANEKT